MRIAYFDCWAGASGDMILGALLDAGASVERLNAELSALGLGLRVAVERVERRGLAALKANVRSSGSPSVAAGSGEPDPGHHHRGLGEIRGIIERSSLPPDVQRKAVAVFERLASVEAAVHGTDIEEVHFHEVGALDAIADVVGACLCLADLSVDEVLFSALPVGGGSVRSAHGTLPIPAPATLALFKGLVVWDPGERSELVTPTGAAVLATVGRQSLTWPRMRVCAVGIGAGSRDTDRPNILRVIVGRPTAEAGRSSFVEGAAEETVAVCETNLDDTSGQVVARATEVLLGRGALDAWWSPCGMKKGRPGVQLTFICRPEDVGTLASAAFGELPTLGIRTYAAQRFVLERGTVTVGTRFGPVAVKIGRSGLRTLTAAPEFEECRRLAEEHGVPVRSVIREAEAASGLAPPEDRRPPEG